MLKDRFLILKFGTNEELNYFIKELIENGHKRYLIELYRIINRLGIDM